jgi:hypothetical protein
MQLSKSRLEITYHQTISLKPDHRNPRVHSDKQVRQIAKSIESFGFNVPLLIDDEQKVIAGHGRLLAARRLGWEAVPAIRLSHLTESQRSFRPGSRRTSRSRSLRPTRPRTHTCHCCHHSRQQPLHNALTRVPHPSFARVAGTTIVSAEDWPSGQCRMAMGALSDRLCPRVFGMDTTGCVDVSGLARGIDFVGEDVVFERLGDGLVESG